MNKIILTILFTICIQMVNAQSGKDTSDGGAAVIIKDSRLAILERKHTEKNINDERAANNKIVVGKTEYTKTSASGIVLTSGFRLMVLSSPDRDFVYKVRGQLMQAFTDKVYMIYQMPNTKLKFGNFLSRPQAEQMRKRIVGMKLVTSNIYIVSDTVEMKVKKSAETSDDTNNKSVTKDKTKKATKPVKAKKPVLPAK